MNKTQSIMSKKNIKHNRAQMKFQYSSVTYLLSL